MNNLESKLKGVWKENHPIDERIIALKYKDYSLYLSFYQKNQKKLYDIIYQRKIHKK